MEDRRPHIDLEGLRALERKATPGPWQHDSETDYIWGPKQQMVFDGVNGLRVRGFGEGLQMDENADLVCTARNALPVLLDELAEKRAYVDRAEQGGCILMTKLEEAEARVTELERILSVERAEYDWAVKDGKAYAAKLDQVQKRAARVLNGDGAPQRPAKG